MINIDRKLRLRDLEVYRFFKDNKMLAYIIIEDTRGPYTEEDKKLDPLCFLDEEDINEIVNVFQIYILTHEPLDKDDSRMLRLFFGELVDISSVTSYIIREYVDEDLYEYTDDSWNVETYQRMLNVVGSNYIIQAIDENNWLYLAQD